MAENETEIHYDPDSIGFIKQQLQRYDLQFEFNDSDSFNDFINDLKKDIDLSKAQNNKEDEFLMLFQKRYTNPNEGSFLLFRAMSSFDTNAVLPPIEGLPSGVLQLYNQFEKNCRMYTVLENAWPVYQKDVLRALAYHQWLCTYDITPSDIVKHPLPCDDINSYLNLPIDPQIHIVDSKTAKRQNETGTGIISYDAYQGRCHYAHLPIGGGLLGPKVLDVTKKRLNLFKKKERYFIEDNFCYDSDITRAPSDAKRPFISYNNLRELLQELSQNAFHAEDIWFLKNTIDPELLISFIQLFSEIQGSTKRSNLKSEDFRLIWLIAGCRAPSIRLYLLEAFKPLYLFCRNYVGTQQQVPTVYEHLFDGLRDIIGKINSIVQTLYCVGRLAFDIIQPDKNEAWNVYKHFNRIFTMGDDFPLILPQSASNRAEVRPKDESVPTAYFAYMPKLPEDKSTYQSDVLTFALISALIEQSHRQESIFMQSQQALKQSLELEERYQAQLYHHINQTFYST